jgi:hypothetical protein
MKSRDSSVGIVTAGRPGFDSRQGQKILVFTASRPVLASTKPPINWIQRGGHFLGIKRTGRETDYSPPSSPEVKYDGTIPLLPHTSSQRGAYNFTLPLRFETGMRVARSEIQRP